MPIIGTLPNNIQNGQSVDANPVMADFNYIVNQVNANANPIGTFTAPSGTRMAFQQIAAPLGWTADTSVTLSDAFLRCNTPSGFANSGGVNGASTLFLVQFTTDGHSLTTAELAAHNHTVTDPTHTHTVNDPQHQHTVAAVQSTPGGTAGFIGPSGTTPNGTGNTSLASTGITNQNASTGITINNNGSGTAHSHTFTANCKFIDQIIAIKS